MTGKIWTDNFEASNEVSSDSDYIKRVYLNAFTCDTSDDNGNSLVQAFIVLESSFFGTLHWIVANKILNIWLSFCRGYVKQTFYK